MIVIIVKTRRIIGWWIHYSLKSLAVKSIFVYIICSSIVIKTNGNDNDSHNTLLIKNYYFCKLLGYRFPVKMSRSVLIFGLKQILWVQGNYLHPYPPPPRERPCISDLSVNFSLNKKTKNKKKKLKKLFYSFFIIIRRESSVRRRIIEWPYRRMRYRAGKPDFSGR